MTTTHNLPEEGLGFEVARIPLPPSEKLASLRQAVREMCERLQDRFALSTSPTANRTYRECLGHIYDLMKEHGIE